MTPAGCSDQTIREFETRFGSTTGIADLHVIVTQMDTLVLTPMSSVYSVYVNHKIPKYHLFVYYLTRRDGLFPRNHPSHHGIAALLTLLQ